MDPTILKILKQKIYIMYNNNIYLFEMQFKKKENLNFVTIFVINIKYHITLNRNF